MNKHSHISQSICKDNLKTPKRGKKFSNETKVEYELPALRVNVFTCVAADITGADNCTDEIDNI